MDDASTPRVPPDGRRRSRDITSASHDKIASAQRRIIERRAIADGACFCCHRRYFTTRFWRELAFDFERLAQPTLFPLISPRYVIAGFLSPCYFIITTAAHAPSRLECGRCPGFEFTARPPRFAQQRPLTPRRRFSASILSLLPATPMPRRFRGALKKTTTPRFHAPCAVENAARRFQTPVGSPKRESQQ